MVLSLVHLVHCVAQNAPQSAHTVVRASKVLGSRDKLAEERCTAPVQQRHGECWALQACDAFIGEQQRVVACRHALLQPLEAARQKRLETSHAAAVDEGGACNDGALHLFELVLASMGPPTRVRSSDTLCKHSLHRMPQGQRALLRRWLSGGKQLESEAAEHFADGCGGV